MYYFGKKPKKSKPSQLLLPAPEVAGTGFGRRSLFGNHMMDKMQPLGQMQPMQFGNYKFGNYKFGKGVGRKKKIKFRKKKANEELELNEKEWTDKRKEEINCKISLWTKIRLKYYGILSPTLIVKISPSQK